MKKVDIIFEEELSLYLVEEFEKKIYYLSEDITSFERILDEGKIIGASLCVADDTCGEKIKERAQYIIKNEVVGLKM